MTTKHSIIDAHAMLGQDLHLKLDADELLRRMDAHGVETAIAHPVGVEAAVDNATGNDRVLKASPRIRGLATANPWFGTRALDELARCRDLGAVGLFLNPSRQGFMPIEPCAAPLYEFAARCRWPILFHTGTYIQSDLLAIAEVARRYPSIAFILGGGGYADMWFELVGVLTDVPNLWHETSMTWGAMNLQVVNRCGAGRVLFGSGEPRNRYATVLNCLSRLDLDATQRRAILYDNAKRLFGLP